MLHLKRHVARTGRALSSDTAGAKLRPRYDIALATTVDVVRSAETNPELVPMRWGLIPGWWKKSQGSAIDVQRAGRDHRAKAMFRVSSRGDDDPSLIEPVEVGANAMGQLDVQASSSEPYHVRDYRNCYGCSKRENGAALEPLPPLSRDAQSKDSRNKIKHQRNQKQCTEELIKFRH